MTFKINKLTKENYRSCKKSILRYIEIFLNVQIDFSKKEVEQESKILNLESELERNLDKIKLIREKL